MKMIIAIVRESDANKVMRELNRAGYSVTKTSSNGGFLRAKNTTLFIGTDKSKIQHVINILKSNCEKRKQTVIPLSAVNEQENSTSQEDISVEIDVGGATIFVLDVERFEKI